MFRLVDHHRVRDDFRAPVVAGSPGRPRGAPYEAATGPVRGFTATDSTTATKTGTPLIETPQSISVVGAGQIEATRSESVPEATRYTAGVRSDTFGFDTRNDWFLIRGFPAQDTGYDLDGLQLFSPGFATFRLEPWGLERLEVLRGPYADPLNQFKVPDHWLTDAALHCEPDGYRAALNVQNRFDRTFVGSCNSVNSCFYGDRRRITASLSYTW